MIKRIFRGATFIQVISLLVFAALVASVIAVGFLLLQDRDRVVNNNDRLIQIYDDLYRQSQAEGIEPTTPDPSSVKSDSQGGVITGPQGAAGQAGRAPTDAEILAAVRSYCANGSCMGERGQAGDTGESITGPAGAPGAAGKDGQSIKGETGSAGLNGANGQDSTVPGPQGPAGPAGADGAPGVPGTNGTNGAPGAGISSITCDGQDLIITTTDGMTRVFSLGTSCAVAQ